jgi:hypothetical protein
LDNSGNNTPLRYKKDVNLPRLQSAQPQNKIGSYKEQSYILNKELFRGKIKNNMNFNNNIITKTKEKDSYNYDINYNNVSLPNQKVLNKINPGPILPYRVFNRINKKMQLY